MNSWQTGQGFQIHLFDTRASWAICLLTCFLSVFMDDEADCDKYVRSNDMIQGDMYVVSSDPYRGGSEWARRPAECYRNFNLGDRLIGVRITEFWCNEGIKDPFLAIYSNCFGRREGLLVCSSLFSLLKKRFYVSKIFCCVSLSPSSGTVLRKLLRLFSRIWIIPRNLIRAVH